jgi:hypothetical protein
MEGGWPMYPILVLGILLLAGAFRYLKQPDGQKLPLLCILGILTLVMGGFGTVLGVIHTLTALHSVPPDLVIRIALQGLGESLNDLSLALMMIIAAGVLASVGALRAEEAQATESDRA